MQKVDEVPQVPIPAASEPGALFRWATSLVQVASRFLGAVSYRLNRVLPTDGTEPMTGPLPLAPYTVATLPPAADHPWTVVAVTDGAGGQQIRASNGASWVNLG